jgi:hypothetical protein
MKNSSFQNSKPELDQDHDIKTTSGRDKSQVQVLFYFKFRSITWYQHRTFIIVNEKNLDDFQKYDLKECKNRNNDDTIYVTFTIKYIKFRS